MPDAAAVVTAIFAGIATVLAAYGQIKTTPDLRAQIGGLRETIVTQGKTIVAQNITIATLQTELSEVQTELDNEKRFRADDQKTIQQLKDRIAELEGMDKRRRRGMAQFEERGLG